MLHISGTSAGLLQLCLTLQVHAEYFSICHCLQVTTCFSFFYFIIFFSILTPSILPSMFEIKHLELLLKCITNRTTLPCNWKCILQNSQVSLIIINKHKCLAWGELTKPWSTVKVLCDALIHHHFIHKAFRISTLLLIAQLGKSCTRS